MVMMVMMVLLAKAGTAITTMATSSSGKSFFMAPDYSHAWPAVDVPKVKRTMLGNSSPARKNRNGPAG